MNYKDPNHKVHVIEPEFAHMLPEGCIAITDAEAEALRPKPVPPGIPKTVTMRQARLALLGAGKLAAVNAAVATMPGAAGDAARIEWEYSGEVHRDKALVKGLAPVLGLTDAQLDALFVDAAAL